jgi:hypothetical protein
MISPPEGWTIIWEETLAIQMKIYGSLIWDTELNTKIELAMVSCNGE